MLNLPLPIVSARSANTGPKLSDVRVKMPSAGSNWYVKPPAEEAIGKDESWFATAALNWLSARNWGESSPMKCATWLGPLAGGARGIPSRRNSVKRSRRLKAWAASDPEAAAKAIPNVVRRRRNMEPPIDTRSAFPDLTGALRRRDRQALALLDPTVDRERGLCSLCGRDDRELHVAGRVSRDVEPWNSGLLEPVRLPRPARRFLFPAPFLVNRHPSRRGRSEAGS